MLKRSLAALVAFTCAAVLTVYVRPAAASPLWHVVRPGDTLASIARMYGHSKATLARWNQLPPDTTVQVDGVMRLNPPKVLLPPWRSHIEPVSPGMVNWNPLRRCPVLPTSLRKVWVSYIDFAGVHHDGSIVVRVDAARRVQNIFHTLYNWRFRITGMAPMRVNNPTQKNMATVTAAYSCRNVGGTRVLSEHASGVAIDINPYQNPMIRGTSVSPANSAFYLNRDQYQVGMLHPEGAARAFLWNGYHWGGYWRSLKDYMHFSLTNR
ncbi:M15 family metallopeptidase [Actinoplanes sp. NPDC048988]|uniref:M15 family metallopeptidase n=1 Tax=Actinoplanes sp. NPDC048988 TaxID=3363901 RepID=UPI00371E9384